MDESPSQKEKTDEEKIRHRFQTNPEAKFFLTVDTRAWAFVRRRNLNRWLLLQTFGVGALISYVSGDLFYGLLWTLTQYLLLEFLAEVYEPK